MSTLCHYRVEHAKKFDKAFSKLLKKDKELVIDVIQKLSLGEQLPAKYKNHRLKGDRKSQWDCHVKGDLILIYEKDDDALILTAINVGSHSAMF